MSWRDRDYSQVLRSERDLIRSRLRLPPRWTFALLILHVSSFGLVLMLQADSAKEFIQSLSLSRDAARPLGILTHPFSSASIWTLALTIYSVWVLGSRVEAREGAGRLLLLYVLGNLFGGAAYLALARWKPEFAAVTLDFPAGGLAAWCLAVRRYFAGEVFVLFNRIHRVSSVFLVAAAIFIALALLLNGLAWVAAILVGGAAEYALWRTPIERERPQRRIARPPAATAEPRPAPRPAPRAPIEQDIDDLLVKISREGMAALTPEDLARLEAARQAKLHRPSR